MIRARTNLMALLLLLAWLPIAPASASAGCVALVGAEAWIGDGRLKNATLVMRDGHFLALGTGASIPHGCSVVDVRGRILTAGFVDPLVGMGLVEVDMEAVTRDASPDREKSPADPVRASFAVRDAYNPRSVLIPVTRISGVTSVVTIPRGGVLSGQSAWADLAGSTQAEAIRKAPVAMHAHVAGTDGSRVTALYTLGLALEEARDLAAHEEDWRRNRIHRFRFPATELRALKPVLDGRLPLVVHVNRAADIEAVLRLGARFGLRLVLAGGAEAWILAAELAERRIPVIVDPLLNAPESFDQVFARADNAALLNRAGVPVMISTFWTHNTRTLPQVVGNAIRAGLSPAAALRAVTRVPAGVFGLPDHGRLEVGAHADVVVWSGDPFELSTAPVKVYIGGRDLPLRSRQTLLLERYRSLPPGR